MEWHGQDTIHLYLFSVLADDHCQAAKPSHYARRVWPMSTLMVHRVSCMSLFSANNHRQLDLRQLSSVEVEFVMAHGHQTWLHHTKD